MNSPLFEIDIKEEKIEIELNAGSTGLQGEKGNKGEDGITPNIQIGTVEKGEEASANITGTKENPKLNLVLPKGDIGHSGVWFGETEPKENYDVWICPDGNPELSANNIVFNDNETLQEKYDEGELKGEQGKTGKDGYTPIKGEDYFTDEEVNDILQKAKDYTDNKIAIFDFIKIVTELPETGLINRTYFVPKTIEDINDLYDEYMWINNDWEFIGTKQIEVDMTDYYKKTEIDAKLEDISSVDYDGLPVGTIVPYSSTVLPTGYLLCDGSEVSRTGYASLFSVIGTTYGAGDGSTTFNLPNLKGKIPVGQDSADADFDTLGYVAGEKEHTLTIDNIPAHDHPPATGGSYITSGGTDGIDSGLGSGGLWVEDKKNSTGSSVVGGSQPHNNLQPYIVLNYIIKANGTSVLTGNVVDNLTDDSAINAPSQKAVNEAIREYLPEYYSSDESSITITPAFDCIAEIENFNAGWGYAGKTYKTEIYCSVGDAERISYIYGATNGHDTEGVFMLAKSIFKLTKGVTYTFTKRDVEGASGGSVYNKTVAKLIGYKN